MKKRIFSWLMAIAMVMSMIPGAAFATTEGQPAGDAPTTSDTAAVTNEAKIGDMEYATLAGAIKAAQNGETVEILADHEISEPVLVEKDLTLDLGGAIIAGKDVYPVFRIQSGATVTVKNGTVTNEDYIFVLGASDGSSAGNLTIESGTYHGDTTVASVTKGTLVVEGGEFSVEPYEGSYNYLLNCIDANYKSGTAKIEVKGGIFHNFNPANNAAELTVPTNFLGEGFVAIQSGDIWTVEDNRVAQIGENKYATLAKAVEEGGEITLLKDVQLDAAIEVANAVAIDLDGHNISMTENDASGDGVFRVVEGGTLTIDGEGTVSGTSDGNNYDMAIWADGGTVVINGGTYTNVGAGEDDHYDLIYAKKGGTVTINGGTFECQTPAWTLNLKDKSESSIVVKGGTFEGFNPAEAYTEPAPERPFSYVPAGYHVQESDGSYTVCSNEDIVGDEVTLDGNITVTSGGIVVDKDTTVNLGGYTVSAPADTAGDGVFHVTGGTLTINGEGTINGVGNNIYSMAIWADGGDVVINGGTYTNVGAGEDDHYDLIYAKNGGTVTINSGTFECQTPAWTLNLKDGSDSSIVVKGGTFKGFDPANGTTENPAVSFVAEGHTSELSGETYVVSPVTYTVTFMDGQNELEQKGINHGVAITKPADPTKDGYAFAGWYTDAALTSAYDFSTVATGDITLYAKWTENSVVPPSTPETDNDDDYTPVRPSNPTVDKEVTENADGSTTMTETKKDGTVIETTKSTDGSTGTTTVDPDGTVTAEVKISSDAVDEADEEEIPVTLPIAPISVTDDTETAATVTIRVPAKVKSVTVEIPVEDVTPGTVVVLVDKDGKETVVNTTGITDNGVVIQIEGDVTVKVVENSKDFQDVSNRDWYSDAADFVSSRGLMNGMTEDTFGHNVPTSRAMVAQILHNMEGKPGHTYTGSFADVGASDWYGDAIHWAAEEGIISGTGNDNFAPNAYVTREQLAVMMWKYAGAEHSDHSIGAFKDYGEISSYAEMALRWAVENGLMSGKGNGQLDPKGNATRAEVASVLMKFYENVKY